MDRIGRRWTHTTSPGCSPCRLVGVLLVDGRHLAIVIVVLLSDAACMVCVSMPLSTARTGRRRRSFEREILDMML